MSAVSDWTFKEVIKASSTVPEADAIILPVPVYLEERRIYLYMEAKVSGAGFYRIQGEVAVYRNGQPTGRFPAEVADWTGVTPNQSVAALFNGGGPPVGDSVYLELAQPFATNNATMHPLRINADIDQVRFSIRGLQIGSVVQGWRAYLGVLSTKY